MKVQNYIALALLALASGDTIARVSNESVESVEDTGVKDSVVYVTTGYFEKKVLESDVPVLVVFTAPWCGPCRILDPVIESLMPEMSGHARVFKVDTDETPEISTKYQVTRLPTIIFFKDGLESHRSSSIHPRDAYVSYLEGLREDTSIKDTTLKLLDEDWFRRHYLLTEEIEVIQETMERYPDLLTREFTNGQSPLSIVLNFPSNTRRELTKLIIAQEPSIGTSDLLGLGRCEEFKKLVGDDSHAANRPDPDGNTPLLTAILGSGLVENGECVSAVLESGAERRLPTTIRNSLGEEVSFGMDSKLFDELLDLLTMAWGPTWYNDDVGVKLRMLSREMMRARDLDSEDLIASRS
ncbi:MAG: thioredoxin domain-containing protein [Gammaproteobacteria bacterium]|nr:thioredoxin domain-containing protein [Gammaproteobacteria bacterium]